MTETGKPLDASGRGLAGDFRVPFPGIMYPYNDEEISANDRAVLSPLPLSVIPKDGVWRT